MTPIGVFVDTNIVERILSIKQRMPNNDTYEQDRLFLARIVEKYVEPGRVQLFVNPAVELEIDRTSSTDKKLKLKNQFKRFRFTSFTTTVFPISLDRDGATFLTKEQKRKLNCLYRDIPNYRKDEKIFADAAFNRDVQFLLTADRNHLARKKFRQRVRAQGLDKDIKVFTPKELFEYLESLD